MFAYILGGLSSWVCFDGFFGGCFLMDFLGGCLGGYFGIVGVSWGGQSSSGLPLWVGYMCGVGNTTPPPGLMDFLHL